MWREGRQYAITVQSDISEGVQGATVTAQLQPELKKLQTQWLAQGQSDYRIEVAGAVEQSSKGSASIAAGVPIMLFITFTLLMLQLQSFSRALLVFLTKVAPGAGVIMVDATQKPSGIGSGEIARQWFSRSFSWTNQKLIVRS